MDFKLKQLGFTDTNILRIARFEKSSELLESKLSQNISVLKKLLSLGFTTSNIASILAHTASKCGEAMCAIGVNVPGQWKKACRK